MAQIWAQGTEIGNHWIANDGWLVRAIVNLGTGRTLFWELGWTAHDPIEISFSDFAQIAGLEIDAFDFRQLTQLTPDLENYILDYSEFAHSAYATMTAQMIISALVAPWLCSPYKQGKLNQFHILVGGSAVGKNDYINATRALLSQAIGQSEWEHGDPASKQALQYGIYRDNYGILMLSEGANFLNAEKGDLHYGCSKILMDVWSSGGSLVKIPTKKREDSTPRVEHPIINAVMEMVPQDFYECLKNKDVAHGGLLPRCSWALADKDPKRLKKQTRPMVPQDIAQKLFKLSMPLRSQLSEMERERNISFEKKEKIEPIFKDMDKESIVWGNDAQQRFYEIADECDNLRLHNEHSFAILSYIWGRTSERAMRTACCSAAFEQAGSDKIELEKRHLDASFAFEKANVESFRETFKEYNKPEEHDRVREKLTIAVKKRPVKIRDFRRVCSTKQAGMIDMVIKQMVNDGEIFEYREGKSRFIQLTEEETYEQ